MLKDLFILLMLGVVAAAPASAQTIVNWVGPAGGDVDVVANWSSDPALDTFFTNEYRFDGGTYTKTTGYNGWGKARIKNGGVLTQDDGTIEWLNGSGGVVSGLALFNGGSTLHMTGGSQITDKLGVGYDLFGNAKAGSDTVNIWGTSTFQIRENLFVAGWVGLDMNAGGTIDIRDTGQLIVPSSLQSVVDSFISSGHIVAGAAGQSLNTLSSGGEYRVTTNLASPPPVTNGIPFVRSYFDSTWHSIPINSSAHNQLAAMGVNVVQDSFNGISLNLAQASGMQGMVDFHSVGWLHSNGGVRYEVDPTPSTSLTNSDKTIIAAQAVSLSNTYSSHPSLLGYNLRDEPHMDEFEALAYAQQQVLLNDPDALPVVDLFPNYASSAQLGTSSYDTYVSEFVRIVQPKALSFNNYIFNTLHSNLTTIRHHALQADIPFWYIYHAHPTSGVPADPTEGELRWQMYTAMAYGAKGVRAFTYSTVNDPSYSGVGNALVDLAGNPTPKYYMVQEIHGEIETLAPILVSLTSTGVFGNSGDGSMVTNISGGDVTYGKFTDPSGATYMMFTNDDSGSNRTLSMQLDLSSPTFNGIGKVNKGNGRVFMKSTPGGVLSKFFAAGDGHLYRALDDITASSAPGSLISDGETATTIDISWDLATDGESGIDYYVIYRDGVEIDTTTDLFFADSSLLENTSYSYRISAVNGEIVESAFSSALSISTLSAVFSGDFNNDGVVDGNDFLFWQRGESPNSGSPSDLLDWENNFGTTGAAANAATAAVPEPSTALLLALGFVGMITSRRV